MDMADMACYSWLRIVCVSKRQIWHVILGWELCAFRKGRYGMLSWAA